MACALAFGVTSAGAHDGASSTDGAIDHAKITHGHQHGATDGHLSPVQENVELVSKLTLKNAVPEKIADVGVHKGYAYLAAWGVQNCVYNGVHVVDVRNPTTPKEVAFIQFRPRRAATRVRASRHSPLTPPRSPVTSLSQTTRSVPTRASASAG